jgi:hypothetical protein
VESEKISAPKAQEKESLSCAILSMKTRSRLMPSWEIFPDGIDCLKGCIQRRARGTFIKQPEKIPG